MLFSLSLLSMAHALIDAASAALAFYLWQSKLVSADQILLLVIIYNILAFGLQTPLGMIADKYKLAAKFAVAGCLILSVAVAIPKFNPLVAIYFAGIGNALFHVGGGIIALNFDPKKASLPGVFVAPGALGLLTGALIGRNFFTPWPFMLLLITSAVCTYFIRMPKIDYNQKTKKTVGYVEMIILLILLSIVVRSVVGLALVFPWKQNFILLLILTLAVFLGKSLGGILADRFGWMRVAMSSLLISAITLPFGAAYPILGLLGIFLFNMTMPITLVAISNLLPGRAGLAFGLTTLGLVFGYGLTFLKPSNINLSSSAIFSIILFSTAVLFFGLKRYYKYTEA